MTTTPEPTRTIANVRVGRADVSPTASTHVRGVVEANQPHAKWRQRGVEQASSSSPIATGTARRSTGIAPDKHEVIDSRMPKLSPA